MNVIGTAGHVDHGKSTIIKNLTSIDPDRLKEEKEREMTIDLGFAWLNNTNTNEPVGIIDVPGHEDLVDNMLKGVFAIDLALLVVAATESIKQQTIEHLEILKLLNIPRIILIVTKKDLASEEMIAGTLSDTKNLLKDYEYDESKNIVVDSTNSEDINKLKNLIFAGTVRYFSENTLNNRNCHTKLRSGQKSSRRRSGRPRILLLRNVILCEAV